MRASFRKVLGLLGVGGIEPAHEEPFEAARDHARLLLVRAAEAGRDVDDATLTPILAAVEAETASELSLEDKQRFFKAYTALVRQTADISRRSGASAEFPFEDAVDDSEHLLKYASEAGTAVPPEVFRGILAARSALTQNTVTEPIRAEFYVAYAALTQLFGQVTAETIRNCASAKTRRALARDRFFAVSLTLVVALISVATFVADSISQHIVSDIGQANTSAAQLRAGLTPATGSSQLDPRYAKEDPCTLLDTPGPEASAAALSVDDVTRLQHFAATIRQLRGRAIKLNKFLSTLLLHELECDPYGTCSGGAPERRVPSEAELNRYIQVAPAITNYTAEVLCKIKSYQLVRTFATNVQADYTVMIGAIIAYALPILYALLGAYAYRLRLFADKIQKRTYHPSFADSARMITAVIAGAIVGLFNPAQGLALSPLATAFLVGYGVELFFRFLDNLLNAFGKPGPATKAAG